MNRAADWLGQAERDLEFAGTAVAPGYHEWTAFAAQQSAEKAVEALVQSLYGAVRGHSITEILRQLPATVEAGQDIFASAQALDKVYVTSLYPNGFASGRPIDYFREKDSQELLAHARRILDFCRSKIP
jgi:HEPN domain-containing protein